MWVVGMKFESRFKAATRRFVVKGTSAAFHLMNRASMKQFCFGEEKEKLTRSREAHEGSEHGFFGSLVP
jgi:hypothetical protein